MPSPHSRWPREALAGRCTAPVSAVTRYAWFALPLTLTALFALATLPLLLTAALEIARRG